MSVQIVLCSLFEATVLTLDACGVNEVLQSLVSFTKVLLLNVIILDAGFLHCKISSPRLHFPKESDHFRSPMVMKRLTTLRKLRKEIVETNDEVLKILASFENLETHRTVNNMDSKSSHWTMFKQSII